MLIDFLQRWPTIVVIVRPFSSLDFSLTYPLRCHSCRLPYPIPIFPPALISSLTFHFAGHQLALRRQRSPGHRIQTLLPCGPAATDRGHSARLVRTWPPLRLLHAL